MSRHTLIWTPNGLAIRADHPNTEEARCGWWGDEVTTEQFAELVEHAKANAARIHAEHPEFGYGDITDWTPENVAEAWDEDFSLADGTPVRHNGSSFYAVRSGCSLAVNDRISVEEMIEGAKWEGEPVEIAVASITGFDIEDEYAYVTGLEPLA